MSCVIVADQVLSKYDRKQSLYIHGEIKPMLFIASLWHLMKQRLSPHGQVYMVLRYMQTITIQKSNS